MIYLKIDKLNKLLVNLIKTNSIMMIKYYVIKNIIISYIKLNYLF